LTFAYIYRRAIIRRHDGAHGDAVTNGTHFRSTFNRTSTLNETQCFITFFFSSRSRHTILVIFQAEDGIRDWSVTGVQTCALPILVNSSGDITTTGSNSIGVLAQSIGGGGGYGGINVSIASGDSDGTGLDIGSRAQGGSK